MIDDRKAAGFERKISFKQYKKYKLRMLQRDFCIKLEEEDIAHYNTLTTETQIDQFCIRILNENL